MSRFPFLRPFLRAASRRLLALSAIWLAILTLQGVVAFAQGADLVEAANKEGQLVAYGDPTQLPILITGFSKKYPQIRVTSATLGGWQAYYRHLNEK